MTSTPIIFGGREMAANGLIDCLAHLDLVKIHGYRPRAQVTDWLRKRWS